MARTYQRKTPDQWSALIAAQKQSGLSAVKFCKQNSIGYASFCKWRQRFSNAKDATPVDTPDFVDLSSLAPSSDKWHITLALGDGVELTLSRG